MLKEKTSRIFPVLGAVILCAGLWAAALWDLDIDLALYHPDFFPAVLMEAFGWLPQYLPAALLAACIAGRSGSRRTVRVIAGVFSGIIFATLAFVGYRHLLRRGISAGAGILWALVFTAAAAILSAAAFHFCQGNARRKLEFIIFWGFIYLIAGLAVISLFKGIWQRTRFDDMLLAAGGNPEGAFALFTGWLHPMGNGGSSFPSGHTAAACSVFLFVLACDLFPSWNRHRTLVWALCWLYIAWMAVCRLIVGRHYLSDTLAAAFLMLVLFLIMTKLRRYREGVKRLNRASEN